MTPIAAAPRPMRELSRHEQAFLAEVMAQFGDLPRSLRRELRDAAVENLAERPETVTAEQLTDDLGPPSDYAAAMREEFERSHPGRIGRSRRRRRWTRWAAVLVAAIVVIGGVMAVQRWVAWQADLHTYMQQVCTSAGNAECNETGITSVNSPGGDGIVVQCQPGVPLSIAIGFTADPQVVVTGATVAATELEGNAALLHLDDLSPWPRGPNKDWPTAPTSWPVTIIPNDDTYQVRAQFTMVCSSEFWSPGSGLVLDEFEIHYRTLGRDRVTTVPLLTPVAIQMPEA